MVRIEECELPGVGHKFTLEEGTPGDKLVVVIRNDGRREMYEFHRGDPHPSAALSLSEEDARKAAAILMGAFLAPEPGRPGTVNVGRSSIAWYEVGLPPSGLSRADEVERPSSSGPQTSSILAPSDLLHDVRSAGATVVGLVRNGEAHPPPSESSQIREGDVLVLIGPTRVLKTISDGVLEPRR